jgi:hypothetical protein
VLLSPKAETALKTRHNYANYFCWWEELLCPIPEWFVGAMPERLTTNEHRLRHPASSPQLRGYGAAGKWTQIREESRSARE